MRAAGLLLALVSLPALAATKLADEYLSFTPTADVDVALCVGQNDRCGPSRAIKAGTYTNCGLSFVRASGVPTQAYPPPAGYKPLQCWTVDAAPVVTPPVVTPPVVTVVPPACYADDATATKQQRAYFDANGAEISETALVLALVTAPKTVYAAQAWYCGTELRIVIARGDEVNDFLMARLTNWQGKTKAEKDALYKATVDLPCVQGGDCIDTNKQRAAMIAKLAPVVVPPSTAPKLLVKPSTTAATDSPVYRLKSDGTRNTTAVSGVRALRDTPCDPSRRIGTTSYYAVPALRDANGDVYAVCVAAS